MSIDQLINQSVNIYKQGSFPFYLLTNSILSITTFCFTSVFFLPVLPFSTNVLPVLYQQDAKFHNKNPQTFTKIYGKILLFILTFITKMS